MNRQRGTSLITINGLRRVFRSQHGDGVALDNVDLHVPKGEFCVLLGPSGSGKTTLLRCVAGLERPDAGQVTLGDTIVYSSADGVFESPEDRNLGMVFQSYAIWPHLTVFENVALPLRRGNRRLPKKEIKERVRSTLELVGMAEYEDRPAPFLSGGQQQRVALARALAIQPLILLMDEPLSNLDARLRYEVRTDMRSLIDRIGLTTLYVTHDQEEAMALGDKIVVMDTGKIVQSGSAEELFGMSVNPQVAEFFGSVNWIEGVVEEPGIVAVPFGRIRAEASKSFSRNQLVWLGVRPGSIRIHTLQPNDEVNCVRGTVIDEMFLGDRREIRVRVPEMELSAIISMDLGVLDGVVYLHMPSDRILCYRKEARSIKKIG